MEEKEWGYLEKLSDRELFDFVTETDASQRKHVAVHLLELRRNQALMQSAKSSARAAWVAAIIAGISAVVAIAAFFMTGAN